MSDTKWAEIPGLDDDYSSEEDDVYELADLPPGEALDPTAKFAFEVTFPRGFWKYVPFYRPKSAVWLWTPKVKWKLLAKFVSPAAAYEYALTLAKKLEKLANEEVKRKKS
jgi:hypothetical protein